MIDFLFLGIIPGTHVQITFGMWVTTLLVFVATWVISYEALSQKATLQRLRLTLSIYLASWRATRLHQRA